MNVAAHKPKKKKLHAVCISFNLLWELDGLLAWLAEKMLIISLGCPPPAHLKINLKEGLTLIHYRLKTQLKINLSAHHQRPMA